MSDPRFLQDGFDKRLAHAIEECGEFLAAAGKTQRWGVWSTNPLLPPAERETNLVWLRREMADVRQSLDRLDAAIAAEFTGDTVADQPSALPCGHPASLLLRSAETGDALYCEACDDKSGRRDAEQREAELSAELRAADQPTGCAHSWGAVDDAKEFCHLCGSYRDLPDALP
jgi:hypothetical protein